MVVTALEVGYYGLAPAHETRLRQIAASAAQNAAAGD